MGKKRGFGTQKLFKAVRMISLVAPAAITAMGPGDVQSKGKIILAQYTGVQPDGSFKLTDIRKGYEPFFWTTLITYGIPKLVSFVKGLF